MRTKKIYVPVKASDRMPNKGGHYLVTCFHKDYPDDIKNGSCQIQSNGEYFFPNQNFLIKEWLEEKNVVLLDIEDAEKIISIAKKFIDKVDTGRARSKETYNDMFTIIKIIT